MSGKRKSVARENRPAQDPAGRREDFLERWSRRKLETQHADQDAVVSESDAVTDSVSVPDEREAVLTDADMPPIETLKEDSDYSPFLSPGVSDDLRHQALRKLFAQPDFNITDGLNDYDEDYTHFTGLGKVVTHEMKRMLQRELGAEQAAADPVKPEAGLTSSAAEPAGDVATTAEEAETGHDDTGMTNDDTGKNESRSG